MTSRRRLVAVHTAAAITPPTARKLLTVKSASCTRSSHFLLHEGNPKKCQKRNAKMGLFVVRNYIIDFIPFCLLLLIVVLCDYKYSCLLTTTTTFSFM